MRVDMLVLDDRLKDPEFAPRYATERAAGIDLRACSVIVSDKDVRRLGGDGALASWTLRPGDRCKIGSGMAVHLDSARDIGDDEPIEESEFCALAGLIIPRSGLGSKYGIVLSNLIGLVDPDYQGQIGITVWNTGEHEFVIRPMERLAQMFVVPVLRPHYIGVEAFSQATVRGSDGFGSTGRA